MNRVMAMLVVGLVVLVAVSVAYPAEQFQQQVQFEEPQPDESLEVAESAHRGFGGGFGRGGYGGGYGRGGYGGGYGGYGGGGYGGGYGGYGGYGGGYGGYGGHRHFG